MNVGRFHTWSVFCLQHALRMFEVDLDIFGVVFALRSCAIPRAFPASKEPARARALAPDPNRRRGLRTLYARVGARVAHRATGQGAFREAGLHRSRAGNHPRLDPGTWDTSAAAWDGCLAVGWFSCEASPGCGGGDTWLCHRVCVCVCVSYLLERPWLGPHGLGCAFCHAQVTVCRFACVPYHVPFGPVTH